MTDNAVDLQELEKLSPNTTSNAIIEEERRKSVYAEPPSQKWQLLLEPALVGAMMAINLGQTSLQNFYLRTACTVDLKLEPSVCDRGVGEDFQAAEAQSQMIVSSINISRSFIGSLLSTIVLLFIGPWSDCSGRRKPSLILPLVGMSVMTTGVLVMLMFPGASTAQVLYVVQIPISLGGNFGLLLAAAFSHIGDVCHATGRDVTRTMGTHRAAIQIAHVVGAVSGPLLYRSLGFYGVFPLVLLLQVSSLAYVIIFMKDVNVNTENKVSVFCWRLPFNAVQCLLKKRAGYRRTIILLMLIVALGDRMMLSAEVLLGYMFYRLKFHWDDVMFGSFLAYRNIVSFAGTLVILTILKRRLRLSDETVGVLSCMSFMFATSGLIAATTTISVFLLPIVGIISQGSQVVQRPLVNKQIYPSEQGKIYSVLGALESATQTISSPLYSLLYSKTVSTLPDAWLLPGLALSVLQLLAYLTTRRLGILTRKEQDSEDRNNEDQVKPSMNVEQLKPNMNVEQSKPHTNGAEKIINANIGNISNTPNSILKQENNEAKADLEMDKEQKLLIESTKANHSNLNPETAKEEKVLIESIKANHPNLQSAPQYDMTQSQNIEINDNIHENVKQNLSNEDKSNNSSNIELSPETTDKKNVDFKR